MPAPGTPVPYPPLPQVGGSQGQYSLESTQLRIEAKLGEGLLLQNQIQQPLTEQQLATAGLNREATQAIISAAVVASLNVALSTRATETSLLQAIVRLGDIYNRLGEINTSGSSIAIDADELNLNTDQLEGFLEQIRDRLPVDLGQRLSAASLAVVLSTQQEAILASVVAELIEVKARLPETLRDGRIKVADHFSSVEHEVDQPGAGAVLPFTLSAAGDFIMVDVDNTDDEDTATYRARATLDGSEPSATSGFVCRSGQTTFLPFPMTGVTVKVWAPAGVVVAVQAGRYAS
jgi:hypothetical protein